MAQFLIPEYEHAENALGDIALRSQQCLIALDVYEKQLQKVAETLPGLQAAAYDTPEFLMHWAAHLTPTELVDYQRRSKQFILLNGWNVAVCLLDDFMKMIASKYWGLEVPKTADGRPDHTWFTPEAFDMVTDLGLPTLPHADAIDDIRRSVGKVRLFRKSNAITVPDYFDGIKKVSEYVYVLAQKATEKAMNDKKKGARKDERNPHPGHPEIPESSEDGDEGDSEE